MKYTVDTLPIFHFYKGLEGDYSLLACDEGDNAEDFINEVADAYNKITGNDKTSETVDKIQIMRLRVKYICSNNALEILRHVDSDEAIAILDKNGFTFDKKNRDSSFATIIAQLEGLLTKINIKTKQYSDDTAGDSASMYDVVVSVEKILKYTIDVQTCPIIKFAHYIKSLKNGE